jgi:hypothetical protein
MPEATTQAVSSPAEVEDPFHGQSPTVHEFNTYRATGEVPARFIPADDADSATAQHAEGDEPENEPATALDDDQEPPEGIGNKARRRFEKLLAEKKELERKLSAQTAKQDVKPAPSAAPEATPAPVNRQKPTIEDKKPDGTPKFATYEDFVEDLADWKAEQRLESARRSEQEQRQIQQVQQNVERDRERYGEEFEKVLEPTAAAIMGNKAIPIEVKRMISASDVLPELIYTIGTDEKTMQKLVRVAQSDPQKAMFYIAELSAGIRQELDASESQSAERTPEKKPTGAPKPPVPVTGPSSRHFDVSDESLSPEEWARKRNSQLAQRRHS